LQGKFKDGWSAYETRFDVDALKRKRRDCPEPLWDGTPLEGKRILLHAEQGYGDSIQFIRYANLVAEKYGGEVIVESQRKMKGLFGGIAGISTLIARGEDVPAFDVHAPLMSLPHILRKTEDTVPCDIPYISAAGLPRPVDIFETSDIKIGFLWAGNPEFAGDKKRSMDVALFEKLIAIPNTHFYSLQFGDKSKALQETDFRDSVEDLGPYLSGFAETASVVDQMDLVITIDTYLAHLAGAMGKPVWVMLSYVPDWRWLLERNDSPWYSTMRLFRQPGLGDWPGVIEEVADHLKKFKA
jgi:hypothetical protein